MLNELAADQMTVILVRSALELACYSTVPRCEIEDRTKSLPTNPGQFQGQGSRPRRRPFPAVGSAGWTALIVLFPVILQKNPRT